MDAKLLQKDETIVDNVLISGETLLWAERTKIPRSAWFVMGFYFILGILVTLGFLFIPWAATGTFHNGNFIGFLPGGFVILAGFYSIYYYTGEHYNVVTDIRVLTCHIKRGKYLRINQLPFRFMDIIDTISTHSLEFKTRQHKTSVKFEHVSDYYDVEKICREQMMLHNQDAGMVKLADHLEDLQPNIYYENPIDVLRIEERNRVIEIPQDWPTKFRNMLQEILNRTDEPEKLLWAYSPPRVELLGSPIFSHIVEEALVIIFSLWLGSIVFWLILTSIVILSFAISTLYYCYFGQAYAITDKSLIVIRKGFSSKVDKQDYIRSKANLTHGMRFSHRRLFPMFSNFKISTGKGHVYLPVPKYQSTLTLANVKEFHAALFNLTNPRNSAKQFA